MYKAVRLQINHFTVEDVITTSGNTASSSVGDGAGIGGFPSSPATSSQPPVPTPPMITPPAPVPTPPQVYDEGDA